MSQWYRLEHDGTASVHPDAPAVRELVDTSNGKWFGTPEGPILHGGIQATAFEQKKIEVFDAVHWLKTGEHKSAGFYTETIITAEPKGANNAAKLHH